MTGIITVIGARGKVGIELLKQLSEQGIPCRAVTRDVKNSIHLPHVTWIGGDLADVSGLPHLLAGSTRLFLNTDFSPRMAEMKAAVIAAAKKSGVRHIAYLSYGLMPEEIIEKSNSMVHQQHIQAEQALIHSGLDWTIIRPSAFMQSWLTELAPTIIRERKIHEAPGEGRMPYIDTRDIAEVLSKVLTFPEKHRGKIYELTGGEPVSFYQVAEAIGQAIGEAVTYLPETPEDTRNRLQEKGYPEWAIQLLLYFAQCQREGRVAYTTNTLPEILGRPGRTIYSFARDYAGGFK